MLFHLYGENSIWQLVGLCLVFAGLVVANEIARRSKLGGLFFFVAIPSAPSLFFVPHPSAIHLVCITAFNFVGEGLRALPS